MRKSNFRNSLIQKKVLLFVGFLTLLLACSQPVEKIEKVEAEIEVVPEVVEQVLQTDTATIARLKTFNLVDIHLIDSSIQVDLKYMTEDNFMKKVLYDTLKNAFLQEEVAVRLSKCQTYLKEKHPNYSILIYDALRPLEVQRDMWNSMDSIPPLRRGKFVSNPARGSVHNYGAAVDVTIVDSLGNPLDMGAGYDDFREIAFPSKEWHFLSTGELTQQQVDNRKLLREVMKSQRFRNIPSEWWHFNAYSRAVTKSKYPCLHWESGK